MPATDNPRTVGELVASAVLTSAQVDEAVRSWLETYEEGPQPIGAGYALDIAEAVAAHAWTSEVMAREGASPALRHNAVRTAVLLARAVRVEG